MIRVDAGCCCFFFGGGGVGAVDYCMMIKIMQMALS